MQKSECRMQNEERNARDWKSLIAQAGLHRRKARDRAAKNADLQSDPRPFSFLPVCDSCAKPNDKVNPRIAALWAEVRYFAITDAICPVKVGFAQQLDYLIC